MKCVPVKCLTSGFGAVRLIRVAGWNFDPGPDAGGPSSMLHDDGASTDNTGTLLVSIAIIESLKGFRTSPEKLKPMRREFQVRRRDLNVIPKMASTTWSVVFKEPPKSSVKGISKFFSCIARRS